MFQAVVSSERRETFSLSVAQGRLSMCRKKGREERSKERRQGGREGSRKG